MTRRRDDDKARRHDARRVGTWRRLYLCFGDVRAIGVAMMLAEHARVDEHDLAATAPLIARPTHEIMAKALRCDVRTIGRSIALLAQGHWIKRVGPRAMIGTAQRYQLTIPSTIDEATMKEASALRDGMWLRLTDKVVGLSVYPQPDSAVGLSEPRARQDCPQSPTAESLEPDSAVGPIGVDGTTQDSREGGRAREDAPADALEDDAKTETVATIRALAEDGKTRAEIAAMLRAPEEQIHKALAS